MNKLQKIIEYGLYLLVFILPIQTRLILRNHEIIRGEIKGSLEYSSISLYLTDILLISLIVLFAIYSFKKLKGKKLKTPIYWWVISGLDLFIFISIFFASDKILSLYRYGLFLLGLGFFWLITKAKYERRSLFFYFFISLSLQGALAVYQFMQQKTFAFKWLGLAGHKAQDLGASVIETIGADGTGERWLRSYGGFDHPNILGGTIAIALVMLTFFIVKNTKGIKSFVKRCRIKTDGCSMCDTWPALIFFIMFGGMLFSFSRSSWLVFASSILFFSLFFVIKKDKKALWNIFKIIVFSGLLSAIIFVQYDNLFKTRISS